MNTAIALLGIVALISCLFATSSAHKSGAHKTATFYTPPYRPSACYGNAPMNGTKIAAASVAIWDHGKACGRFYRVKCIGATNDGVLQPCKDESVVVKIVDLCPFPVCQATVDLSQEVFETIADPDAGKIQIELIQV